MITFMKRNPFRRLGHCAVRLVIFWLIASSLAEAQDARRTDNGGSDWNTVEVGLCLQKEAAIKGGDGKVEVSSLDALWNWSFLSLEYQGKSYNWRSSTENPFSPAREPVWNTLSTVWLTAGYSNAINSRIQYLVDADVFVSFEKERFGLVGDDVDGVLFFSLPLEWSAYAGLSIHHSPFQEDVYPLLGIMHGVESEPGWMVKIGIPETTVQYRFNPRYSLDAGFSIFNVDYYLLAIDPNDEHDRYLETSDNRLLLILNRASGKNLRVGVGVQYAVDNQLMFYSANQQNRTSYQLSSVPGILLNIQYRF